MVQQFITVLAYHDLHPDVKWISEQLFKIVAVEAYINEIEAYINGSIRSSRSIHKWYGMMQHGVILEVILAVEVDVEVITMAIVLILVVGL